MAHRIGRLQIGEAAVQIAVAGGHRAESFAACRHAIDRLKERVPIFKKEVYEDDSTWKSS
jgi:molybdopterin synthase catalytic subunit